MEKFKLLEKNGIYYFEKNGQNFAFSYSIPFTAFSNTYKTIQICSKPIIKKEVDMFSIIEDNLGDAKDMFKNLPESAKTMLKNMLKNPKTIKPFLQNSGLVDQSLLDMLDNVDSLENNNFEQTLNIFKSRTGLKFDGLIGKDTLMQFIIVLEKDEIIFFTDRFSVGDYIGNTYQIVDLSFHNTEIYLKEFITINDKKYNVSFDTNVKNIYFKKEVFEKILTEVKVFPQSSLQTEFFNEMGIENMTLFQIDTEIFNISEKRWIGEFGDFKSNFYKLMPDIDGSIPLNYLGKSILIDGIHKKFGYKKM